MSASLGTHSVGVIMLGVHDLGMLYSCTSAEIVHTINDIPSANLIIGQGSPLSSSMSTWYTNGNLSDLLNMSTELRKVSERDVEQMDWGDGIDYSAVEAIYASGGTRNLDITWKKKEMPSKLLRCSIYEADAKGTDLKAIFRGYIVNVLELSRAGDLSVRALRVQCMGIAAILHVAPLAGYRRTSGAAITNAAAGLGELPTARANINIGVIDSKGALENTSDAAIANKFAQQLISSDILTRIAYIANTLVYMSEARAGNQVYQELEEANDDLLHIRDCIFCQYMVSSASNETTQNYTLNANLSFNKFLCGQLLQTLQSSSVLMSIGSVCTGTDVMMNMVPHFKLGGTADDFRMELKPSEAWDATDSITIPNTYVRSCNSTLNHLEHLNDPQVLIVNYSSGVGSTDPSQENGTPSSGCFGVYSPIEAVQKWAKIRYGIENKAEENRNMNQNVYRTRFYPAPKWLDWSYLSNMNTKASSLKQPAQVPANDDEAKAGKTTASQENRKLASDQADAIAKALYAHLHGSSDVAAFDLTPDIRFGLNEDIGCLEDSIGRVVNINGYRGMLQSVRYTYTSGKTTTGSYSITISRVRPYDEKEEPITCPLYVNTFWKERYATTDNQKYWKDDWNKK